MQIHNVANSYEVMPNCGLYLALGRLLRMWGTLGLELRRDPPIRGIRICQGDLRDATGKAGHRISVNQTEANQGFLVHALTRW